MAWLHPTPQQLTRALAQFSSAFTTLHPFSGSNLIINSRATYRWQILALSLQRTLTGWEAGQCEDSKP